MRSLGWGSGADCVAKPKKPGPGVPNRPGRGRGKPKVGLNAREFLQAELKRLRAAGVEKGLGQRTFVSILWSNRLIESMPGLGPKARQAAKRAGAQSCKLLMETAKSLGSKIPAKMETVVNLFEEGILELEQLPDLANGPLSPEDLDLFERKKEALRDTLGRMRKRNQKEIRVPAQQLKILGGLSQTVLKWSLGEKLFVEYWDKMAELQDEFRGG